MTNVTIIAGDNRVSLGTMPDNSIDAVVTDPPYSLISITKRFGKPGSKPARADAGAGNDGSFGRVSGGFMGKAWDASGIERDPAFWAEIYRVLKPGAFMFAFSGARTGHWQACAMETAGFIMHPMHAWIYGCMDPETECLTRRGWSKYWEIAAEDEVLQWDAATGALTWTRPKAIHEYPFEGEMVVIENRNTRQILTPNHRVYAKVQRHARHPKPCAYEVVEASDLDLRSISWNVDLPLAGDLRDGEPVDPAYAYLVGWWLTDAWPHRDANACCFSQSKPETLAKLRKALARYGASEYVRAAKKATHRDEHSFYLTGPMADRLRTEFPDRALPWGVLGWARPARAALYRGLMDGDGSQPASSYAHTFWSKDQERRDVFMAIALSLEMRCHEDAAKGAIYVNTMRDTTQIQDRHRSARIPHTGMVWCLTVPTGAFVVRRDGKPFITGNSGFPKGHDASKAIDRHLGTSDLREVVGTRYEARRFAPGATVVQEGGYRKREVEDGNEQTFAATDEIGGSPEARQWDGWKYGTQTQKPAMEPIFLGQKPYDGKPVESILKWGVGAFNIDGCRVPGGKNVPASVSRGTGGTSLEGSVDGSLRRETGTESGHNPDIGRHPANVLHDNSAEVIALFPDSKGQQAAASTDTTTRKTQNVYGAMTHGSGGQKPRGDSGSAARFFNSFPADEWCLDCGQHPAIEPCPELEREDLIAERNAEIDYRGHSDIDIPVAFYHSKAGKVDRAGSRHPTVKPIGLLRHLIRHICPPGGTVLDPFAGSGTTAEAARLEGMSCVLMEAEPEYLAFLRNRFGAPASDPVSDFDDLDDLLGSPLASSDHLDINDLL